MCTRLISVTVYPKCTASPRHEVENVSQIISCGNPYAPGHTITSSYLGKSTQRDVPCPMC